MVKVEIRLTPILSPTRKPVGLRSPVSHSGARRSKLWPWLCNVLRFAIRLRLTGFFARLTPQERRTGMAIFSKGPLCSHEDVRRRLGEVGIPTVDIGEILGSNLLNWRGRALPAEQFVLLLRALKKKRLAAAAVGDVEAAFIAIGGGPDTNVDIARLHSVVEDFHLSIPERGLSPRNCKTLDLSTFTAMLDGEEEEDDDEVAWGGRGRHVDAAVDRVSLRQAEELKRLQQASWSNIKREVSEREEMLRKVAQAEDDARRRMDESFAVAARELRRRVKEHSVALRREKARTRELRARLHDAEALAARMEAERDALAAELRTANDHVSSARLRVESLTTDLDSLRERHQRLAAQEHLRGEDEQRERAARVRKEEEERQRVDRTEHLVRTLREQASTHAGEMVRLRSAVEDLEAENTELSAKLAAARSTADQARQLRVRGDELLDERERLQRSNGRLLALLQRDGAYADLAADLAYVPVAPHSSPLRAARGEQLEVLPRRESEYWIPLDVFRLASAFRQRHLPASSEQHLRELLVECNKVWKAKALRSTEIAERRVRKEAADRRSKAKAAAVVAVPGHLAGVQQELAALRRELARHKGKETAYVSARQHARALDTAVTLIESLLRRAAELDAESSRLRSDALSRIGSGVADISCVDASLAQRAEARRRAGMMEEAIARVLSMCADARRCLGRAARAADTDAAETLRAVLDIQTDFINRMQRESVHVQAQLRTMSAL
eukprot:Hpha_TRINITY_DN16523_c2_g5::TRINITY_DN16523_c2_g5_i1::g.136992::m.136992